VLALIGVVTAAIGLGLLILPFWTFIRVHRLSRQVETLTVRMRGLEDRIEGHEGDEGREGHEGSRVEEIGPAAPSVVPTAAPSAAPEAARAAGAVDFERRFAGHGLLYVGVLILLLGVSFFLRYAFENEWVGPWGRVGLGLLGGLALIRVGLALDTRGLPAFGRVIAGAGLAILYLSIYAALVFYDLIGRGAAFAFMVLVTAAAAGLADRRRAQSLAIVAVGGGFLTPFLVGGDRDAQLALFTYDALLVAGTLILAGRHQWPLLNALTYVLTVATLAFWAFVHYSDGAWLRTLLFLSLFCGLFVAMLRQTRRAHGLAAGMVAGLLWSAPALYHVVALFLTAAHPPAIHVYLIVFTVVGLLITTDPPRPALRLLVLLAAIGPMFGEGVLTQGPSWLMANLVAIGAVCGVHLMTLVDRVARRREPLSSLDLAALHLASLGLFGLLHRTLTPVVPGLGGSAAALVAAMAGLLWWFFNPRDRMAAMNAAALTFTLIAAAITLQFDGRTAIIGWAVEGAAVAFLGLHATSRAFTAGGLFLWSAAALRLTDGYFTTPTSFSPLVNERSIATLVVIGLGYVLALRAARGTALVEGPRVRAFLHVASSALTLLWVSAEIQSFWDVRDETPQAYLLKQLLLSLGWGAYGASAIGAGLWRAYPPLRYIGMVVIACTVLKVFFVDLWDLGGIYRVVGFLTLGLLLVLVSYLYQTGRTASAAAQSPPPS
jgi:uncharacterized membrane protein